MAGLLDFLSTPSGIGLLSGVASYAANARRGQPVNSIGRGLIGGLTGYQAANDQIRQDADGEITKRYRQMQMDEMQRKMEQAKAQQTWKAGLPQMMDKAQTKVTPFQPDDPFNQGPAAFGEVYGGDKHGQQTDALMANVQQGDPQALQQYLMQPDSPYADKLIEHQFIPKDPEYKVVGNSLVGIDRSGVKPVYTDSGKPSSLAQLLTERAALAPGDPNRQAYDDAIAKATTHAPPSEMNNYGSPVAGIGPDGKPVFFQPSKAGTAPSIVQGVSPRPVEPKPPTGEENTAAGYLGRMKASERLLGGLEGGQATVGTSVAGSVPFIGDYVQRKAMSQKQQQYKQAADDWIRAKLRKESGAVIADEEMLREYQTYFPQPGDKPGTIKQKAMARRQAEEQMIQSAGRAAPQQTEVPFSKLEMDYMERRRAEGVSDTEIAFELQHGAAKAKSKPTATFDLPPNAKQYEGKTLRDTKSGKRFKSINGKWVPQ